MCVISIGLFFTHIGTDFPDVSKPPALTLPEKQQLETRAAAHFHRAQFEAGLGDKGQRADAGGGEWQNTDEAQGGVCVERRKAVGY